MLSLATSGERGWLLAEPKAPDTSLRL